MLSEQKEDDNKNTQNLLSINKGATGNLKFSQKSNATPQKIIGDITPKDGVLNDTSTGKKLKNTD